jgi:hypothetical protein
MGEITVGGDRVYAASIDGQQVTEITIDGCSITFEETEYTGWQYISGGSGEINIDLSDAHYVLAAGIRFKKASPTSVEKYVTGSYSDYVYTNGSTCDIYPDIPDVPSPPFGCLHSSPSKYGLVAQVHKMYEIGACVRLYWHSGWSCTTYTLYTTPMDFTTNPNYLRGCIDAGYGGTVRGRAYVRTYYYRACYSASNYDDVTVNYINNQYYYDFSALGDISIVPYEEGIGTIYPEDDDSNDIYWELGGLIAGQNNVVDFTNIQGSGRVYADIFYTYY